MTVYRCKVRKPNGEIVDGCGFEFQPTIDGPCRFDDVKCDHCGLGFLRAKVSPYERAVGRIVPRGAQSGRVLSNEGMLEDMLAIGRETGSPQPQELPRRVGFNPALAAGYEPERPHELASHQTLETATELYRLGAGKDRLEALRHVLVTVRALAIDAAVERDPNDGLTVMAVRQSIALLQSLLPANAAADKQAQVAMAAEHNATADFRIVKEILEVYGGPHSVAALERLAKILILPGEWVDMAAASIRGAAVNLMAEGGYLEPDGTLHVKKFRDDQTRLRGLPT